MAKLKIEVNDKNLPVLLNILDNLKAGLINNMEIEKQEKPKAVSSSISNDTNTRYMSKEKYKQKLQQKVLEDEFLPKTTQTKKYLSPEEFKKKLKGL